MNSLQSSLGKTKYKSTDSAPIGCKDCSGCSRCCQGMGDTIIQDPYDFWNFSSHMRIAGGAPITFELLISADGPWELSLHDGLRLPNIKMVEDGRCPFLNAQGRCGIHSIRSGLCRLYPLARIFEPEDMTHPSGSISYAILGGSYGCPQNLQDAQHIPISSWLGISGIESYEAFQCAWHKIRKDAILYLENASEKERTDLQDTLLRIFYHRTYQKDFFRDFAFRKRRWDRFFSDICSSNLR